MIIPVRCFTCGKVVADKYEKFTRRVRQGEDPSQVLDDLGLNRYCCRRMILAHIDIIDSFMAFATTEPSEASLR
ncbi:MAG: DNA-directed RNA polymerase subunit N [Candidatus Thorarchaeota archaeon]|nr:MAG: DNA-directed RNA polymerase subunit N [Candidatus Thorarchaeota archaeon]